MIFKHKLTVIILLSLINLLVLPLLYGQKKAGQV